MKATKITMMIQAVGMYLAHIPLYILLIPVDSPSETYSTSLLGAAITLSVLLIPVCLANIVLSALSIAKGDVDPTEFTLKIKIALIPWYVMNFVIGLVFVGVFANPFLMLAIPVALALLITSTYFYMLSTSLWDAAYFIRRFIKNENSIDPLTIIAVVCLFIFCLDVVGSIILYKKMKNAAATDNR